MAKEKVTTLEISNKRERQDFEALLQKKVELKLMQDTAKSQLSVLNEELASLMIEHGLGDKTVEFDGFTHYVLNGTNASISKDRLREHLMNVLPGILKKGVDSIQVIKDVLEAVVKETPYTTVTTSAVKEEKPEPVSRNKNLTSKK